MPGWPTILPSIGLCKVREAVPRFLGFVLIMHSLKHHMLWHHILCDTTLANRELVPSERGQAILLHHVFTVFILPFLMFLFFCSLCILDRMYLTRVWMNESTHTHTHTPSHRIIPHTRRCCTGPCTGAACLRASTQPGMMVTKGLK
jgi:hypothetical protein